MNQTWRIPKQINLSGKTTTKSKNQIMQQIQQERKKREEQQLKDKSATLIQSFIRRHQVLIQIPNLFKENYEKFRQTKSEKEYGNCVTSASLYPTQETMKSSLILFNYSKKHPLKGKLAWNLLRSEIQLQPRVIFMLMKEFINQPIHPIEYPKQSILKNIPETVKQQFIEILCNHSNYSQMKFLDYLTLEEMNIFPLNNNVIDWMFRNSLQQHQQLIELILNNEEGMNNFYRVKFISEMKELGNYSKELIVIFQRKQLQQPTKETIMIYIQLYKLLKNTTTLIYELLNIFPLSFSELLIPFIENDSLDENKESKQLKEDVIELYISILHHLLTNRLFETIYDEIYPSIKFILKYVKVIEHKDFILDLHLLVKHTKFPPSMIPIIKSPTATIFSSFSHKISSIRAKTNDTYSIVGKEKIKIRRDYLIEDSLAHLSHASIKSIGIVFIDEHGNQEDGIDGGGLLRDYLVTTINAFIEKLNLFERNKEGILTLSESYNNNGYNQVSIASEQELYNLMGKLIGKCLHEDVCIDLTFSDDILMGLINPEDSTININTLASIDQTTAKNLLQISKMDEETLKSVYLDFTYDGIQLIKNGSEVPVNKANVNFYIQRVIHYITHIRNKQKILALRNGLLSVINEKDLLLLFPDDLQIWLCGKSNGIDVNDWRFNSVCQNSEGNEDRLEWFWEIVEEMSEEEKSLLLQFSTSLIKPPLFGFSSLDPKFGIQFVDVGIDHLPTSSTCFYLLRLPKYNSKEEMKRKILQAITAKAGFGLG